MYMVKYVHPGAPSQLMRNATITSAMDHTMARSSTAWDEGRSAIARGVYVPAITSAMHEWSSRRNVLVVLGDQLPR
jgi:hypothetical protein